MDLRSIVDQLVSERLKSSAEDKSSTSSATRSASSKNEDFPERIKTPPPRQLNEEQSFVEGRNYPIAAYYGADYPVSKEPPFRNFLQVIFRYKWTIAAITVLVLALTVVATKFMPRRYTSTAMVSIGTYLPPVDGPMAEFLKAETMKKSYLMNQTALLKSYLVARRVLQNDEKVLAYVNGGKLPLRIPDTGEYLLQTGLLNGYLGHIKFEQIKGSTVIKINATAKWPSMATQIANAHAQAFIEVVRAQRVSAVNVNLKFLEEQVEKSKENVANAKEALAEFTRANAVFAANVKRGDLSIDRKLGNLVEKLSQAALSTAAAKEQIRQMSGSNRLSDINFDNEVQADYLKLLDLEEKDKQLRVYYRSRNHPVRVQSRQQIDVLKKGLRMTAKRQLRDAQAAYRANLARESFLQGQLTQTREIQLDYAQKKVEYDQLYDEHQTAKEEYQQFFERFEDAIVNAESDQQTVTMVEPGVNPTGPSSPNAMLNLLWACFIGPALGIFLAFTRDSFDQTIHSTSRLKELFELPILGVIPVYSKKDQKRAEKKKKRAQKQEKARQKAEEPQPSVLQKPSAATTEESALVPEVIASRKKRARGEIEETTIIEDKSLFVLSDPMSSESEAFRRLRTLISHANDEPDPKVLLVTSGQKEDGKTLVACNLALSFASKGEKTLLIDADLRLPSVYKNFGLSPKLPGLATYLSGEAEFDEVVLESGYGELSLMPAGSWSSYVAELISSDSMIDLVEALRASDEFDRIVIDSPPIARVADALTLSKVVDGVAIVVRSNKTPEPVVESVIAQLRQMGAPILGTILNAVKAPANSYESDYYLR